MKRVVHLLMSDYSVDSRVKNETISLAESGFDVTVFCLKGKRGIPPHIEGCPFVLFEFTPQLFSDL